MTGLITITAAIFWSGQAASKQPEYLTLEEAVEKAIDLLQVVTKETQVHG
jgi:hypothetical protein